MRVVTIFVPSGLAIAQALFDLFLRNPEFFIASISEAVDVILVVFLFIIIATLIIVCEIVAGLGGQDYGSGCSGLWL